MLRWNLVNLVWSTKFLIKPIVQGTCVRMAFQKFSENVYYKKSIHGFWFFKLFEVLLWKGVWLPCGYGGAEKGLQDLVWVPFLDLLATGPQLCHHLPSPSARIPTWTTRWTRQFQLLFSCKSLHFHVRCPPSARSQSGVNRKVIWVEKGHSCWKGMKCLICRKNSDPWPSSIPAGMVSGNKK